MSKDQNDLEPIEPGTALELYLADRRGTSAKKTIRHYRYRLKKFVEWCESEGIDNLNDLTGRRLHQYRLWRQEDGDLKPVTINGQMSTLRIFLRWCGTIEAVPADLYDKVTVPRVSITDEQRNETLDSESAQEILQHLSKYHYASREHLILALLWESGMRMGGAIALDLRDVDTTEKVLTLVHRPETGTPLKNGELGERMVALSPELSQLIDEHRAVHRHETRDEHGREPLLTTIHGRITHGSVRRMVYRVTSPCFRGESCPDCAGVPDKKCGEAVSPHAIRRGSITHFLTHDVPIDIVSDRMNVSRKVLDKHYDKRSEKVKVEQRRSYLQNI
jgi:site-specific recombinase XerD